MKNKSPITIEELPPIMTAQHIADLLILARNTVYELFDLPPDRGGIPNFRVGNSRRATKEEVIKWIARQQQTQIEEATRRINYIEGKRPAV